jgi:hypothetical protein
MVDRLVDLIDYSAQKKAVKNLRIWKRQTERRVAQATNASPQVHATSLNSKFGQILSRPRNIGLDKEISGQ